MNKRVLYHLIGGQLMPTIMAARHVGAYRHVLFHTQESKKYTDSLQKALAPATCTRLLVDPYDFISLQKQIGRAVLAEANCEHWLNFTGGTKLMSIAAFEVFTKNKFPCIYVDSENRRIIQIHNGRAEQLPLTMKLSIADHFFSQHYVIEPPEKALSAAERNERSAYAEYLSRFKYWDAFMQFRIRANREFEAARKKRAKRKSPYTFNEQQYAFEYDWKKKTATITTPDRKFSFSGADAADYALGGFWFETLVKDKKIPGHDFDEVAFNVKIKATEDMAPEADDYFEFDMVAVKNERLYIFELKSGSIEQQAINKLAAVHQLFGKYTMLYLVQFAEQKLEPGPARRLKELGIHYVTYPKLDFQKITQRKVSNL